AYLATKLDSMPEGNGTVLDNSCLMFLSNLWIGRLHDNRRLPLCSLEVWAAHSRPDVRSIISMLATTTVRCGLPHEVMLPKGRCRWWPSRSTFARHEHVFAGFSAGSSLNWESWSEG